MKGSQRKKTTKYSECDEVRENLNQETKKNQKVIEMDPDDDRCNEKRIRKPLSELDQNVVRNQEREDEAIRRVSTWKRIIRVEKEIGYNISYVNKEN